MKQYVLLFEDWKTEYTQETAAELVQDMFGKRERERMWENERFLSQELGEMIGAQIWRKWHMPLGWDENKTCRIFLANYRAFKTTKIERAKDTYFERMMNITKELIKENPEIQEIPDYNKHMNDVVFGMVSRFNLDDIKFFVQFQSKGLSPGSTAHKDPEWDRTVRHIDNLLARLFPNERTVTGMLFAINWVPAPSTLQTILNRLLKLQKQKRNI